MAKSKAGKLVAVVLILLIVAAAAAAYTWYVRRPEPLVLSGTIEAHTVQAGPLVAGRVASIEVEEGAVVHEGQTIMTLETASIDRQLSEQVSVITAAKAQLEKTLHGPRSEEIAKAEALHAAAERERKRYAALLDQGVVSRELYDGYALQEKTTARDLEQLKKGSRVEDIAAARAEVERVSRHLETLEQQKREHVVKAPVAGTVQSVGVRRGDLVQAGAGAVEIVEAGALWVRVYVPETVFGLVKLGMPAAVHVDTYQDRSYHGVVRQINEQGEYTPRNIQTRSQRADQVFGVKVVLDPSSDLKPGMAAEVDLGVQGHVK